MTDYTKAIAAQREKLRRQEEGVAATKALIAGLEQLQKGDQGASAQGSKK